MIDRPPPRFSASAFRDGERRGMALWFVLGLVTVFVLGGMVLFNLTRGLTRQVEYADASLRAQYIGESAYNQLYARLSGHSWDDRWFAAGPDSGSLIPLHGGAYDYFIADNPYRPMHADIFVRAEYKNARRCFYWLVRMKPGLLVSLAQNLPVGMMEIEPERLPTAAGQNQALADQMERIIATRQSKAAIAGAMESGIKANNDVTQAITQLGGVPPAGVVRQPVVTAGGEAVPVPPAVTPVPPVHISNGFDPSGGKTVQEENEVDAEVIPVFIDYFPDYSTTLLTHGQELIQTVRNGVRYIPPPPPTIGRPKIWNWWEGHKHDHYHHHRHGGHHRERDDD
ncbi:MAG: hypothetical protein OZSIB_0543 [Candidatus Ozemobacter sibiricus]|uniref:Uncharacterized protein n=1 Tax=Candidatus Ozemobacter sibiricus TaxID=2268124 RepID=A0A367ZNN1_9BACT|nr:MAG: hypothetical protein OZSIB_0543 [Candidatus Ozemobacter sibiricus]